MAASGSLLACAGGRGHGARAAAAANKYVLATGMVDYYEVLGVSSLEGVST